MSFEVDIQASIDAALASVNKLESEIKGIQSDVQINADTSGLDEASASSEEASGSIAETAAEAKVGGDALGGLASKGKLSAGAMGGLAAAAVPAAGAVGGLMIASEVAQQIITLTDQVSKAGRRFSVMAQRANTSTKEMQEYAYAAEQAGVDGERLSDMLAQMPERLQQATEDGSAAAEAAKELGVEVENADGSLRSSDAVFKDVASSVSQAEDQQRAFAAAQELLGGEVEDLRPLLNEGAEGIEAYAEELEATGAIMSDDLIESSNEYRRALNRTGKTVEGIKNTVAEAFLPAMTDLVNVGGEVNMMLQDVAPSGDELKDTIQDLTQNGILWLLEGGVKLISTLQSWMQTIKPLAPVLSGVGKVIAGVAVGVKSWISLQQILGKLIFKFTSSILQNFLKVLDKVLASYEWLAKGAAKFDVPGADALEGLLGKARDATQGIDEFADKMQEGVSGSIEEDIEEIGGDIEGLQDIFGEDIESGIERALESGMEMSDELKRDLEELQKKVREGDISPEKKPKAPDDDGAGEGDQPQGRGGGGTNLSGVQALQEQRGKAQDVNLRGAAEEASQPMETGQGAKELGEQFRRGAEQIKEPMEDLNNKLQGNLSQMSSIAGQLSGIANELASEFGANEKTSGAIGGFGSAVSGGLGGAAQGASIGGIPGAIAGGAIGALPGVVKGIKALTGADDKEEEDETEDDGMSDEEFIRKLAKTVAEENAKRQEDALRRAIEVNIGAQERTTGRRGGFDRTQLQQSLYDLIVAENRNQGGSL